MTQRTVEVHARSPKGGRNALDHFYHSTRLMASGTGERLHDGWCCPCPAGHRRYRAGCPAHSGTKSTVEKQALAEEGEASGKEVDRRSAKIL